MAQSFQPVFCERFPGVTGFLKNSLMQVAMANPSSVVLDVNSVSPLLQIQLEAILDEGIIPLLPQQLGLIF